MESPNQYLSPEPSFARIASTSFEIQGSKVCSTIRPLPLRHCFGRFQGNHVWKAPTSTFHQNLLLPGLLQPVSRSKGPKCARLSAPPSAPLFWLVSRKPYMESPNQYLSPEPSFARIAPTSFEIQGSKVCSTIRPLPLPHCFGWFQGNHVWKAPTSTFHRNLFLPRLLQPVSRCKGPKCARVSAPCHRHNNHKLGWKHEWMPTGSSGAAAVHFSASNGNIYLPLSPPPQTQAQAEALPCERPRPWSQGAQ